MTNTFTKLQEIVTDPKLICELHQNEDVNLRCQYNFTLTLNNFAHANQLSYLASGIKTTRLPTCMKAKARQKTLNFVKIHYVTPSSSRLTHDWPNRGVANLNLRYRCKNGNIPAFTISYQIPNYQKLTQN